MWKSGYELIIVNQSFQNLLEVEIVNINKI